jgi:LysR family transcriptional regulator, low CO2-responsive transcriptional regulator
MTLNQLRTFLAVVDTGSVRAAAERLIVSQPAVSGAVASLERELGIELVARDGRGLRVTSAGAAFAASARAGLARIDHGVRAARSTDEPGRGTVRIAAVTTAAERVLLPLLAGFRGDHPHADVAVRVGNRATVWDALRRHDADLVVAGRPPAALEARILGRRANRLVVVGPPRVRATRSHQAMLAELAALTWLLREEGSGTREASDELLVRLDLDPPRMVLGSNGAVEEAAVNGFGVALISLDAVRSRIAAGELAVYGCPGTPFERPWHLVASGDVTLTPTAALAACSLLGPEAGFTPTAQGRRVARTGDLGGG